MTTVSPGQAAALRAGVEVRELLTAESTEVAASLLREVWMGSESPVPANLLRTVQHTGGYVFGAFEPGGDMVAASLGLRTAHGLHSHVTGVAPAGQRRGLGYALKQHQRTWALERGMSSITWTCDPLVRRNVVFNLHALGATVSHYLPNFYGAMPDGLNRGDESDRFELHWDLLSDAAVRAERARLPFLPERGELVELPEDIEGLRRDDPAAAQLWRRQVREVLVPALAAGHRVLGMTASGSLVLSA